VPRKRPAMFALRFALLFFTWCAFSGLFDAFHLSLGAMASAWVAAISTHIALSQPSQAKSGRRIRVAIGLFFYIGWLLVEVFKANFQVLILSFSPGVERRLSPQIVEFRSALADDFSRFLLALSI